MVLLQQIPEQDGWFAPIDAVDVPALEPGTSYSRSNCPGDWVVTPPTPSTRNLTNDEAQLGDVDASGYPNITDDD